MAATHFTPDLVKCLEKQSADLVKGKATFKAPTYQNHFLMTKTAINNAFKNLQRTTALVLGVGAAQDIDLKALAMAFEKIHLVDIDLSETKKSLAEQVPEEDLRAKFEV